MFMLSNIFCYVYLTIIYFLCLCAFQLFFYLYFSLLRYLVCFMELLIVFMCFILLYLIMAVRIYYSAIICGHYILCLPAFFYVLIVPFLFIHRQNSLFGRILPILYQSCGAVSLILHLNYLIT